jgi:uncharacterized membrane protein YedE/YeeE
MTTTVLDRVDLDAITVQARQVRFWRTVLTVIAGLLFGAGWVTAKAFGVMWLAAAWTAVAVREGWREGRGVTVQHGPSRPG